MKLGLGVGLANSYKSSAVSIYDSAADALFDRFTSEPDDTRKGLINQLILDLKTATVWNELDALYVMAAHDSQAAQQNWKADTWNLSPVSAPTFTTDRGYTGNGSTSYLATSFNPTTSGGLFAQDDAHQGVYILTDATGTLYDIGNTLSRLNTRSSTVASFASNRATGNQDMSLTTSIGWTCWSRDNSANASIVKNKGTVFTPAVASTGVSNLPFYICCNATTGPAGQSFSTRQIAVAHWGAALDDTQRDAFYDALTAYLTAVGAL